MYGIEITKNNYWRNDRKAELQKAKYSRSGCRPKQMDLSDIQNQINRNWS